MAKKKKRSTTKRRKQPAAPEHTLPVGFWQQVSAVLLIAFSILLAIAWFDAGGPVMVWLNEAVQSTIGYAVYILPFLFVYLAVEIFRAEENKIPWVVKFASVLVYAYPRQVSISVMFSIVAYFTTNCNGYACILSISWSYCWQWFHI